MDVAADDGGSGTRVVFLATRAASLGVWDWDVGEDRLVWDDGMYALYGVRREDFDGAYAAWSNAIHPEDRARAEQAIQDALHGVREYAPEFRIILPGFDGHGALAGRRQK